MWKTEGKKRQSREIYHRGKTFGGRITKNGEGVNPSLGNLVITAEDGGFFNVSKGKLEKWAQTHKKDGWGKTNQKRARVGRWRRQAEKKAQKGGGGTRV